MREEEVEKTEKLEKKKIPDSLTIGTWHQLNISSRALICTAMQEPRPLTNATQTHFLEGTGKGEEFHSKASS